MNGGAVYSVLYVFASNAVCWHYDLHGHCLLRHLDQVASWVLLAFDGIEWYLFRLLHVPLVLRGHELTIKSIDVNYVLKLS